MDAFIKLESKPAIQRAAEHGGHGAICFRRMMDNSQFASALDFVDFTVIPAGSSIGRHFHHGSEELYFVVNGFPVININGQESRVGPGSLTIVRSGQWHSLTNDTLSEAAILVVQAHVSEP
jgi:mannose-6-phosphate isomerase-like protein (cupin superfamily)